MATVTRLLPWRRQMNSAVDEVNPVLQSFRRRHPKASTTLIIKAFEVARQAHSSQTRKSGEGYINDRSNVTSEIFFDIRNSKFSVFHSVVEKCGGNSCFIETDICHDLGDCQRMVDVSLAIQRLPRP